MQRENIFFYWCVMVNYFSRSKLKKNTTGQSLKHVALQSSQQSRF
uniref:Uncharacterized protein n=1 Tax=Rhizophora mucronata TaxID=61149 RepID=A0A2P2R009_RHIMU